MPSTFRYDDHELQAFLKHYTKPELEKILQKAAAAGARAAAPVLVASAPVGRTKRQSQFYRRQGAGHGMFRASIKARRIRRRGIQKGVIGFVVGPAGKFGFTRHWIAGGTRPHLIRRGRGGRIRHPGQTPDRWADGPLEAAGNVANARSEQILRQFAEKADR